VRQWLEQLLEQELGEKESWWDVRQQLGQGCGLVYQCFADRFHQ
jgi:hypothetical protein